MNYSDIITEVCSSREQRFVYTDTIPDRNVIERILKNAYSYAPSKQLLVPYASHVYGPDCVDQKRVIYDWAGHRSHNSIPEHGVNSQLKAPYLLLFSTRVLDAADPNPNSTPGQFPNSYGMGKEDETAPLEIGMFMMLVIMYAKAEGLDVSFCGCVNGKKIAEELDIAGEIWCTMAIGYAEEVDNVADEYLKYRHNSYKREHYPDRELVRPAFEKIVNIY